MKAFVSYTSSDREWAHWIGWQLKSAGHEPFVHEWEIGAGQNIPRWMEDRLGEADRLVGVFSDTYCKALYSQSERWAAYWQDPGGRIGFLVPIEVTKVTKWPVFVEPLKRLSLIDLEEAEASKSLIAFLEPPKPPVEKPAFPGTAPAAPPRVAKFAEGGEPLGASPPSFPATLSPEAKPAEVTPFIAPHIPDPNTDIRCIDDHEPKPQIFGRDDEVETIVRAVLEGKTTLVAGGPGMGKTAVATAALYDPRVIAHFGRRRVFASLETVTEPRAIFAKLVEALGLSPIGDEVSLLRILETNTAETPIAAILDNAEMVFDADRGAAERLLNLAARVKGLSLVVTIRGVAPPIPGAIQIDDLPKLDASAAREAFLAVAGVSFSADSDLPHLLEALDGHALSIRLVAAQAIGSPSLRGLRESWDDAHAAILRMSGEEEGRLTSVRASLALSLNSRLMKAMPLARRLVGLLAYLPAGMLEDHVKNLLGERGTVTTARANDAVICLHKLRLIERRPDHRLRMLTPLREAAKGDTLTDKDCDRIVHHYLTLAVKAKQIGHKAWGRVREEVEVEADNLDAICDLAVNERFHNRQLAEALRGLARFHVVSGKGAVASVEHALSRFRRGAPSRSWVDCTLSLGDVARLRSDRKSARGHFQEALTVSRRVGDKSREAESLRSLGEAEQYYSNYDQARINFEQSLSIYRGLGNLVGEGGCLRQLGDLATLFSEQQEANSRYEDALKSFMKVGYILGEANCLEGLADLACRSLEFKVGRERYEKAFLLSRQAGNMLGEANNAYSLGKLMYMLHNFVDAKMYLDDALVKYRSFGSIYGEANCLKCFGEIARINGNNNSARAFYMEALALYRRSERVLGEAETLIRLGQVQQIQRDVADLDQGVSHIEAGFAIYFKIAISTDRAFEGWRAMHRALTSVGTSDRSRHREKAKIEWTRIGRLDLVQEWTAPEFGPE